MRLYLAVLDTLGAGHRVAQAAHALTELALAHPAAFRAWREAGGVVVAVALPGDALAELTEEASTAGDASAVFHEPDRGGERTAIAVLPRSPSVRRILRQAPLLG